MLQMLIDAYVLGYLLSALSLSIWLLFGSEKWPGKVGRIALPLGLGLYFLGLMLVPLLINAKLFVLFRDLGLLAILGCLIWYARFNKILAFGLLAGALYLGYKWYLPIMLAHL